MDVEHAVLPCRLAGEPSWGGDVYRTMLVEGLSELLSELRYLLLGDGLYGGDKRAQAQVHGGAGR